MSNNTLNIKNRDRVDHSRDEVRQEVRTKRTPVGGARNILTVEHEIPGKHLCWVNDDEKGSVQRYLAAGYEFVKSNMSTGETTVDRPASGDNSVVSKIVSGDGMIAYLMAVPIEYYEEDMAAEQAELDAQEQELYRAFEGAYNPNAKIGGQSLTITGSKK